VSLYLCLQFHSHNVLTETSFDWSAASLIILKFFSTLMEAFVPLMNKRLWHFFCSRYTFQVFLSLLWRHTKIYTDLITALCSNNVVLLSGDTPLSPFTSPTNKRNRSDVCFFKCSINDMKERWRHLYILKKRAKIRRNFKYLKMVNITFLSCGVRTA
jgi:hypothetical protein